MREQLDHWLNIPATDPHVARRGRLLNIVLLGYGVIALVMLAILLFFWWQDPVNTELRLFFIISAALAFCALTYELNRHLSNRAAAGMFVLGNLILAALSDTPFELAQGRSLLSLTIPIVMASMFLHPLAGFATASFAFGIVIHFNAMLGEVPPYPSMLIFFIIALFSWLATDTLEDSLREMYTLNRELDRRVEERTRELQATNAELEARNAELDAFAHSAAHDIKTPLTTLYGFSKLLARRHPEMPAEELAHRLDNIAHNALRVCNIVDELLLLATVRQMEEVPLATLEMPDLIAAARQRLAGLIAESEAEIALPANWPTAYGYAPWIEEVWVNYLSNALKYGGQPPRVELGATELPEERVCFWVQDNGAGLTPDECTRLFIPFTRLAQTRAKGHGLGLSIVQRILTRLDGEVGVESSPGAGSRFSFTLPRCAPPSA